MWTALVCIGAETCDGPLKTRCGSVWGPFNVENFLLELQSESENGICCMELVSQFCLAKPIQL
jgi:hypothetical protein